jgi:OFA family oxalate/formate antiporter-like MFS transporter
VNNRWIIALAGMVVMMTLGAIYSWSLFSQPLIAAFGWSNTTTTSTFALAIFFLALGAVVGGRWQDRVGPRTVALTGIVLWGAGNILAGLGTPYFGPWWIYLTYGAIGGFGVGMGYITSVATVTKWFPERRGLGGGVVVMGFGLGAVFYTFIVKSIPSFAAAASGAAQYAEASLASHAAPRMSEVSVPMLSAEQIQAVMNVFLGSGMLFLVLGGAAACLLANPPIGYTHPGVAPADTPGSRPYKVRYTTREMLRTPQFYLLWLMLFVNVSAGILVISNALPIMQELSSLTPEIAAAAYGGLSLFNALGRFFWGGISDRIGRKRTYLCLFGIQVAAFFLIGDLSQAVTVAIAVAVVLLCFGGGFGTMPSYSADYFGTRHMGANYGALLTAWGCAGIAGPLFASQIKDATGSFAGAFVPISMILLLAMILPAVTRKPGGGQERDGASEASTLDPVWLTKNAQATEEALQCWSLSQAASRHSAPWITPTCAAKGRLTKGRPKYAKPLRRTKCIGLRQSTQFFLVSAE